MGLEIIRINGDVTIDKGDIFTKRGVNAIVTSGGGGGMVLGK